MRSRRESPATPSDSGPPSGPGIVELRTTFRKPLMPTRRLLVPVLLLGLASSAAARQRPTDHGSIVIVMGGEPSTPVPTLLGQKANDDVSDLLFLRLARPGPG